MTATNTDRWSQYFANVNDSPSSILFDDGLSERINEALQTHALKIEIKLNKVREDGLPAREEWTSLNALIDTLEARIQAEDGLVLGHATYSGHRWLIALIHADTDKELRDDLDTFANEHGYSTRVIYEEDLEKSAYWQNLYPDEDSRQVLNDGLVLENLAKHNDDAEAIRLVDHWSYFQSKSTAQEFANYLKSEGYKAVKVSKEKDSVFSKPQWLVRSQHEGTMLLNDITGHTLRHSRKASQLGGNYDGWETQVIASEKE